MKILKSKTTYILSGIAILAFLFLLFDSYINKISKESLANWLKTEEFSIAEGNLLSSVTKNQRTMLASEFIKGVVLLDNTNPNQRELIEFGEKIDSKRILKSKMNSNDVHIQRVGLFQRYVYAKIPGKEDMVIVFSIWSSGFINVYLIASFLFLSLFVLHSILIGRIKQEEFKLREAQTKEYAEKAARAAHDIRSPLTILNALIEAENKESSEFKGQLSSVIKNLREVTQDLVSGRNYKAKYKIETNAILTCPTPTSLKKELEIILENKKLQYLRDKVELSYDIQETPSHIKMPYAELRRSLSNILDNAYDAILDHGTITFKSYLKDNFVVIDITDTGVGIPEQHLNQIGKKGFSFGKSNGSGLGVHYTKLNLESIGGDFCLTSKEGIGTTVQMKIPLLKSKVVSDNKVEIEKDSHILILDDEPLIHKVWKDFFQKNKLGEKVKIHYYSTPQEILEANYQDGFLFTDFDLSCNQDGLDIVASLGLSKRSLLVTGQSTDVNVKSKAQSLGVPVFAKERLLELEVVVV